MKTSEELRNAVREMREVIRATPQGCAQPEAIKQLNMHGSHVVALSTLGRDHAWHIVQLAKDVYSERRHWRYQSGIAEAMALINHHFMELERAIQAHEADND